MRHSPPARMSGGWSRDWVRSPAVRGRCTRPGCDCVLAFRHCPDGCGRRIDQPPGVPASAGNDRGNDGRGDARNGPDYTTGGDARAEPTLDHGDLQAVSWQRACSRRLGPSADSVRPRRRPGLGCAMPGRRHGPRGTCPVSRRLSGKRCHGRLARVDGDPGGLRGCLHYAPLRPRAVGLKRWTW